VPRLTSWQTTHSDSANVDLCIIEWLSYLNTSNFYSTICRLSDDSRNLISSNDVEVPAPGSCVVISFFCRRPRNVDRIQVVGAVVTAVGVAASMVIRNVDSEFLRCVDKIFSGDVSAMLGARLYKVLIVRQKLTRRWPEERRIRGMYRSLVSMEFKVPFDIIFGQYLVRWRGKCLVL
jgi:hypothetical protein